MDPAQEWTGRSATALRLSLRLSGHAFAARLEISPRTVAYWKANPDVIPRASAQDALDALLDRAAPAAKTRYLELVMSGFSDRPAGPAQALRVAIAIVVHNGQVLLVRRRDAAAGITWQFPAGVIKPGMRAEDAAVRETLAETGVHCSVREHLGRRLHPTTGVYCDYFWCDYLAGEVENRDTAENAAATWAAQHDLTKFVPREKIYPPIMDLMEEPHAAGF